MSDTHNEEDVSMEALFDEQPNDGDGAGTDDEGQDATVADLFGDDEAGEEESTREASAAERQSSATPSLRGSEGDGLTEAERKHRKALEYEEEDGEEAIPQVLREAEVNIPKLPLPTSSDSQYWMMRMPNFLKLDTKPFHQDTYEGPQEDYEGEERKEIATMLDVTNTIRWRWVQGENGEMKKESNSRIVRWSDGSMSLQLGTEIFDVTSNYDGIRPTASASQSQSQQTPIKRAGGLSYLYTQHKHAGVLQCEIPITGTMTLQPTGMFSATHKQLVRAVGQRHSRTTRLRLAPEPTMDPEREQRELQKTANRSARPRKPRASTGGGFGGGGGGGGGMRRNRTSAASRRRDDVFASDDSGGDANSDSDGGFGGGRKVVAPPKRGGEYVADDFVVSDEEDEDGGGSPGKRKKRGGEADTGMDSLDEADERIEREAAKRRKKEKEEGKAGGDSDADADEDVDMEDSADEDGHSIRKAGGKTRSKRRAVALEDEDDDE